jgi:hypothetical protein
MGSGSGGVEQAGGEQAGRGDGCKNKTIHNVVPLLGPAGRTRTGRALVKAVFYPVF